MRVKPYKKDFTYSYTEGVFPTIELINYAPETAVRVIVSGRGKDNSGVALLKEKCCALNIHFTIDDQTIQRISPKGSVMAIGIFEKKVRELDRTRSHVVFVNPADMGNIGTIIRTAASFDLPDIAIIEPAADYYDPKAIRASMGAFFRVRVHAYPTFEAYRKDAGEREFYPFMLKGRALENPKNLPQVDALKPRSLIFGNESRGLEDCFLDVGTPLRIEHLDTVDSLNLTIAAGIAMHWHYNLFR